MTRAGALQPGQWADLGLSVGRVVTVDALDTGHGEARVRIGYSDTRGRRGWAYRDAGAAVAIVPPWETVEDRQRLVVMSGTGDGLTLDGHRAILGGWRLEFPVVARLDGMGSAEFAWATVALVVARGGRFQS